LANLRIFWDFLLRRERLSLINIAVEAEWIVSLLEVEMGADCFFP
jgi:hypothetical protein